MSSANDQGQSTARKFEAPALARPVIAVLFIAASLATLIGLFYAVEKWRGHRAWHNYLNGPGREGPTLDWNAYIAAPVPDEQNIFKAPHMQEWFVKASKGSAAAAAQDQFRAKLTPFSGEKNQGNGVQQVMELTILPAGPNASQTALSFGSPEAQAQVAKMIQATLGPALPGSQNFVFLAHAPDEIKPVSLVLKAGTMPTVQEVRAFLPTNAVAPTIGALQVQKVEGSVPPGENAGTNVFRILVTFQASCCAGADYLAWSAQLEPDLQLVAEALKRPYARMDGDYQQPFAVPVPNFVIVRSLAQILGQRAQCHLLAGQPEAALRDLTLVQEFRRLLEAGPEHKPMTLVATMIDAAVAGLYVDVIADGLRLGAWREPELMALQQQLGEIELIPYLWSCLAAERAAFCHLLTHTKTSALNDVFSLGNKGKWLLPLTPQGWVLQNMASVASFEQKALGIVDPTNLTVSPMRAEAVFKDVESWLARCFPYRFLARVAVPNFSKAAQTLGRHESLVRQAQVACALERCRLAAGHYPETLDELVPKFLEKIPRDTVEGMALRYVRKDAGYILYSIGWNDKDDGGAVAQSAAGGDWLLTGTR